MGLKQYIQNRIHEKEVNKYRLEVARQSDAYQAFIDVNEMSSSDELLDIKDAEAINDKVTFIQYSELTFDKEITGLYDYIIFINGEGCVSDKLSLEVIRLFDEDPELEIIYYDEDEIDKNTKKRCNPWFKSDFSLTSALASFYFGNIVAVRRKTLEERLTQFDNNPFANLYGFILELITKDKKEALHIPKVMFHRYISDENYTEFTGSEEMFDYIKERCYGNLGVNVSFRKDRFGVSNSIVSNKGEKILIVIPSKDHPDVLRRCVKSVKEISTYDNFEVVVVDNGSNEENRHVYEAMATEYGYSYIYEPMEFNFSKMCNIGASSKESDYIVFLNDDTEIITDNWLEIMLGEASLSHVGAVGAKLYYNDGETIQHIGITNMTEGPSHKLQGHKDSDSIYHGVNRYTRGVIGVTAACLMVSREKYNLVGGFNEQLKVAYNDVYFCFALYGKCFENVIRNDVILLHYESLSRGDDHASREKMDRLKEERIKLYNAFPALYGVDPYYSMSLTGASETYQCILPFENRNIRPVSEISRVNMPTCQINEALIISVDRAEEELFGTGVRCAIIDLHCHVRGLDNADYSFSLMLKKDELVLEIPVIRRIRPDVIKVLYNECHVELSGFVTRIPVEMLPEGSYEIWMKAKSLISRQVLINKADELLSVSGNEEWR